MWNESFFSAPQLKRHPLDGAVGFVLATHLFHGFRDFAAGKTSFVAFEHWLRKQITESGEPTPSADRLSFSFTCLMYLDFVVDGPEVDEREARRLAGAFCAISSNFADPDDQLVLGDLARWAPDTARSIRAYLDGDRSRAALELFLSRRRWWSDSLRSLVKRLSDQELEHLATGMENDNYQIVAAALNSVSPDRAV